jgi:deoxyadenosine/deoxycytidine kinase
MKTYPFVVVSGIIGAGKSTLTSRLADELTKKNYPVQAYFEHVEDNPYLAEFYEGVEAYEEYKDFLAWDGNRPVIFHQARHLVDKAKHTSFAMQIHLLTSRYLDHKRIQYALHKKIAIQDRSIFEDSIFVKMLHRDGLITHNDKETYAKLFRIMSLHFRFPDIFIYLDVTPECALQRVKKRSRNAETSLTLEYLRKLNAEYNEFASRVGEKCQLIREPWGEENGSIERFVDAILKKC